MSIVRAKKTSGTTFLKDQNIACKITASLLPVTKGVLEIGPGMGVLTRHLLKDTKFSVLAIDIDQESIDYLHEELPAHKEQIIYGDFLKSDIRNFYTEPFSIIGNLPYNISSQIFFSYLRKPGFNTPSRLYDTKRGGRTHQRLSREQNIWNFKRIPANILRHRVPFHRGRTGFRSTTKSKIRRNPTHPE